MMPNEAALVQLLHLLDRRRYDFVTPTPVTHARVITRRANEPTRSLRDVLGWSLPFEPKDLDPEVLRLLEAAGVLERRAGLLKSAIRVSRVQGLLFIHSAYPPEAKDAVFLGPDSYRFAQLIADQLQGRSWLGRVADIGGGSGVGALTAAAGRRCSHLVLTDINPKALIFARASAAHAGTALETFEAAGGDALPDELDLVLANPPYIGGAPDQIYQDGGGDLGTEAALEWTDAALRKLAPGGRFILYCGSPIRTGGRDALREQLLKAADAAGACLTYREIDPDVFGEELEKPVYRGVERIAAVGAVLAKSAGNSP
jgi:SAM-dependent methyltransferase